MEDEYSRYRLQPGCGHCSTEMLVLHSDLNKFRIWRQLWIWLAEAEQELGVDISPSQINEMKMNKNEINIREALAEQKHTTNEVSAHLNVFGRQCPEARPIINLGATEFYSIDNANLIILRNALNIILPRLADIIYHLKNFAEKYRKLATLAFIHLQPLYLTTIGKRACLWIQDLLMDERTLRRCKKDLRFLGIKGAIGTQLNIVEVFNGDYEKVKKLEQLLAKLAGFEQIYLISGQTYSRKVEAEVLGALSGLGTTIHKICYDLRILAFRKIIEEAQSHGASITYSRVPSKSEKCCSLARYLISSYAHAAHTHATEWLEGTLDDSAIRRLRTPEAFLCADAILIIFSDLVQGLVVFPKLIQCQHFEDLPFMAMNKLITTMVNAGMDRAASMRKIRSILNWAVIRLKQMGQRRNILQSFKEDPFFEPVLAQFPAIFNENAFTGRASKHVTEFLEQEVDPVLKLYDIQK